MKRPRLTALLLLAAAACLSDRVIEPPGLLPAVIGIDKPTVQFVRFALGRSVAADTVRVTNNGGEALGAVSAAGIEYVSGTRTGWLAAAIVAQGNDTSALILTPAYADSAGTPPDTARVTLRAAGAQATRVVTVVARTIPGARFEFSANPVTFAAVPGGPPSVDQAFSVRNGGNGDLPIYPPRLSYVSAARGWLVVTAVPGSDPRAPSFTITASTGALASGLHTAYVVFESPAGDPTRAPADSFIVQTRIGEPRLGVSSGVVSFSGIRGGAEVAPQTITLSNAGEGTLESLGEISLGAIGYKAGEATGWLAATVAGNRVVLTATTGTLPASTLTAQLPVTSQNGGSAILTVTFEVRLPGLTLSSRSLAFNGVEGGASPPGRSVTISNSGSGSLATLGALSVGGISFAAGQPTGWLTATLVDSVVTVNPTLGGLGPGTYSGTVAVTSENGGGEAIAVTFTVARANDPPALALSATTLTLSGTRGDPNPPAQTVAITNTGGGSLGAITFSLQSSGGSWLTAALSGSNVFVGANTGQLNPGTYQGTVAVVSEFGGSAVIAVTFTVGVPVLTLSAVAASFGATEGAASPAPRTVAISNTGSGTIASLGNLTIGTISYGAGQPNGWLTAARAGTVITLTPATGSLNAGLYTATVPVSSANGGASAIAVTLSIVRALAQPVLALSSTSLSFSAPLGGPNPPSQNVRFFNSGGGVDSDLGAVTAPVPGTAPWLTAVVGPTGVTFSVAVGSLAAGVRTATVPVNSANGGTLNVVVSFTIPDPTTPPELALSRTAAAFSAVQGAASPPNQTITVTNAGGGSLGTVAVGAVTYTGASTGWLTRTLGAATGLITLSVATAALPPGVSTATFAVSTTPVVTGSPATITVTLTVAAVPAASQLSISSTTVSFAATEGAASPAAQTLTASNTGSGGLAALGTLARGTISYSPAGTWLTTATIAAATGVITVQPTTDSLAPGIYNATFGVTASTAATGSPRSVSVTVTVGPPASGGVTDTLTVSSLAVSFAAIEGGAAPAQKTVTISNPGPGGLAALGTLSVDTVVYNGPSTGWLTTASVAAATGVVSLRPTTGSLTAGTYDAVVVLAGTTAGIGSPQTVTVSFTVSRPPLVPSLSLSAQSASFAVAAGGASPAAQTIDVVNLGGGSLGAVTVGAITYSGASTGWLAAAFAAATSRVTLTPTTTGLPAGSSSATFAVASPAAAVTGSPRTVTVYLTVTPAATPPALTLSAEAASFAGSVGGAAPANQVITVSNTGGGSLGTVSLGTIAYAGGSPGWLTPTLAGANLTLSAVIGARAAGTYTATFPVSSAAAGVTGSPVTVTARLSVAANAAPPVLTLATQAVSFAVQAGANPPAQTVAAINTGGGTLASLGAIGIGAISYTGTSNGWLTATAGGGGIITLTPAAAGLPSGSSTASFQVTSANGGSSPLSVTLTVAAANAAPSLALSLSTVAFDAIAGATPPAPQVVTVSNAGGGTLGAVTIGTETFVPSQPSGWLASPTSGAAVTGSITFAVASSGLPAGVYTAAVPVTTANAGVKNIAVTLRVQAPILTLSTRAVSFSATQGTSDPAGQSVTVSNTGIGTLASLGTISLGAIRYGPSEPVGWLSGAVAGSTVSLTARLAGLPSGSFTALVPIVSAFGGTDTVTATFTVAPGAAPPVLSLSSGLVSFSATVAGANPTPQAVTFSNSGGQTLGAVTLGAASPDAPWLDVSLAGNQIRFAVDVSGLAAGAYATQVAVETANAGSENIGVALTIGAPRIALSTRSVTFGDTVGSTRALTSDVFISNSGAGDLASLGALRIGTITPASATTTWLQSPTSGAALTNPIVALRASVGTLAAGSYTATIPVTSEQGGSETITLTMTVNRPDPAFDRPAIEFFQNDIAIDSAVAPRALGDTAQFAVRVKIGNPNNTAIALSGLRVGAPAYVRGAGGWITGAFLDKTSAPFGSPAELLVAINPAGLPAGRHRAEIEIRSDVAKNSPRKLSVVLVVQ